MSTPLRTRMIEDMKLRGFAPGTVRGYVHHIEHYAKYFWLSPEKLDLEAVRQFELYLLEERKLSPESINQFVSAAKFLYLTTLEMPWGQENFPRVRRPYRLPVVLSMEEMALATLPARNELGPFQRDPQTVFSASTARHPSHAPRSEPMN